MLFFLLIDPFFVMIVNIPEDDSQPEFSNAVTLPSFCPWVATTRLDNKSENPEVSK